MFNWTPEEIWCQLNFHFLLTKNQFNCFLWNRHQKEPVFAITYQKTWQLRLTSFYVWLWSYPATNPVVSLKGRGYKIAFLADLVKTRILFSFKSLVGSNFMHPSWPYCYEKNFCSYGYSMSWVFNFLSWSQYFFSWSFL